MTSSAGSGGCDVDQHLASDHELHSTSIPCDVGDAVSRTTSGLAHGATEDMLASDVSVQSFQRRDHDSNGWTTACTDADMSGHYLQDTRGGRVPASTLDDNVTRFQDNDDDTAATTASFGSSDALTSSCAAVARSYMHLRSKTSR